MANNYNNTQQMIEAKRQMDRAFENKIGEAKLSNVVALGLGGLGAIATGIGMVWKAVNNNSDLDRARDQYYNR